MAQQNLSQESVSSSSSAVAAACGNRWEIHANCAGSNNLLSTWTNINAQWPLQIAGQHSNALGDHEDLSINVNACNQSGGLSMDSSTAGLSGEPVENNVWSQILFGTVGSIEDMQLQNHHENRKNLLEVLTSRSLTREMLEPSCGYMKRMDNSWEFTNNISSIGISKQLSNINSSSYNGRVVDQTTNLLYLIGNCSIALPNAQLECHPVSSTCNVWLTDHSMAQYSTTSNIASHVKHETVPTSPSYPAGELIGERRNAGSCAPWYDIDGMKRERPYQDMEAPMHSPGSSCTSLHSDLGNLAPGLDNYYAGGPEELPFSSTKNLSDLISFSGCLNNPAASIDLRFPNHRVKSLDLSCSKKQGHQSSTTNRNGRAKSGATEGKKRAENSSETTFKKPKHEASTVSSIKLQAPKVKLADKITALQQLVSPFGKTDTASVLLETINCIKILQEQVQLLSDPYMKSITTSKDHSPWGDLQETREKIDKLIKFDLKSNGLCLVPVSCVPPPHRENNGPDYWMPPYRSCLYR